MFQPLNSALAAALAAGAVVAATAIGDSDTPSRRTAPAGAKPVLVTPTRAEAIEAAEAFRHRANDVLARKLGVSAGRLLAAERAIVARRLSEAVDHGVLTAGQRDALLTCFDDLTGCDRGALPVLRGGPALGFGAVGMLPARPPHVRPRPGGERPRPRSERHRRGRAMRLRIRNCRGRARERSRRPVRCLPMPVMGAAEALAKELSLPPDEVARALRRTFRQLGRDARGPQPLPLDPDGVPLGAPFLPGPLR